MLPLCRRAMRARQLSAAGELPWWTWCLLASILAQEQSRQLSCPRLVALSLLFVKLVSVKISDGGRVAYSTFAARNSGLLRRSRTGRAVRAPFQHREDSSGSFGSVAILGPYGHRTFSFDDHPLAEARRISGAIFTQCECGVTTDIELSRLPRVSTASI